MWGTLLSFELDEGEDVVCCIIIAMCFKLGIKRIKLIDEYVNY